MGPSLFWSFHNPEFTIESKQLLVLSPVLVWEISSSTLYTCILYLQVGDEGAGHFVKMVHNGIEYGDMQLCCEAYHLMKDSLGMGHEEMSSVSITATYDKYFYYLLLVL